MVIFFLAIMPWRCNQVKVCLTQEKTKNKKTKTKISGVEEKIAGMVKADKLHHLHSY